MNFSPEYSVENGTNFQWSSITGNLNVERVQHLQRFLVGKEILDAGCGGGAFVEFLAARGLRVTGVDYHEMFLDIARQRPGSIGTYLQGDVTSLPFPDKNFDTVFCFDVLEHVDDHLALKELIRVARSRVIIAVPATDANNFNGQLTFFHYQDLTHLRTYTTQLLENLCRSLGQDRFQVFPELPVTLQGLSIQHLVDNPNESGWRAIGRRFFHRLLKRGLGRAHFRTIHMGLVAVIDVESGAPNSESR